MYHHSIEYLPKQRPALLNHPQCFEEKCMRDGTHRLHGLNSVSNLREPSQLCTCVRGDVRGLICLSGLEEVMIGYIKSHLVSSCLQSLFLHFFLLALHVYSLPLYLALALHQRDLFSSSHQYGQFHCRYRYRSRLPRHFMVRIKSRNIRLNC